MCPNGQLPKNIKSLKQRILKFPNLKIPKISKKIMETYGAFEI